MFFIKESWAGTLALGSVLINTVLSSWIATNAVMGHSFGEIINTGVVFGDIPILVVKAF